MQLILQVRLPLRGGWTPLERSRTRGQLAEHEHALRISRRKKGAARREHAAAQGKLDFEYVEIGALLNAIETHLESGMGHADVVQCYENVFVLLTTLRGINPDRITKAKAIFRDLKQSLRTSPSFR